MVFAAVFFDRAELAGLVHRFEAAPCVRVDFLPVRTAQFNARPVNEVEVDVVQTEVFKGFVHRFDGLLVAAEGDPVLGRYKNVFALYAGRTDAVADADFVGVAPCGIHVAVAEIDRGLDEIRGHVVRRLPGTVADRGDLYTVRQSVAVGQRGGKINAHNKNFLSGCSVLLT